MKVYILALVFSAVIGSASIAADDNGSQDTENIPEDLQQYTLDNELDLAKQRAQGERDCKEAIENMDSDGKVTAVC